MFLAMRNYSFQPRTSKQLSINRFMQTSAKKLNSSRFSGLAHFQSVPKVLNWVKQCQYTVSRGNMNLFLSNTFSCPFGSYEEWLCATLNSVFVNIKASHHCSRNRLLNNPICQRISKGGLIKTHLSFSWFGGTTIIENRN